MALSDVTDVTFEQEVLQSAQPVLVDFWAEWCAPCRRLHDILQELDGELAGRVRIVRLDVAANPEVPSVQGVLNIPTLILYRDGQPVERFGFLSKDKLKQRLEEVL